MGLRGFPPNVSHEIMFQTLVQYDKEIQSYPSAKERYRNGVLIVARENVLYYFLRIMNHLFSDP